MLLSIFAFSDATTPATRRTWCSLWLQAVSGAPRRLQRAAITLLQQQPLYNWETATLPTHHPTVLSNRLSIKHISSVIRKNNRKFRDSSLPVSICPRFQDSPPPCNYSPRPRMPQEKQTFRLQNVSSPSFKIVKKMHTRWSQTTKKQKKRQNSR